MLDRETLRTTTDFLVYSTDISKQSQIKIHVLRDPDTENGAPIRYTNPLRGISHLSDQAHAGATEVLVRVRSNTLLCLVIKQKLDFSACNCLQDSITSELTGYSEV